MSYWKLYCAAAGGLHKSLISLFLLFSFLFLLRSLYSKPEDLDAWVSSFFFFVWILLIPSVMLLLCVYRLLLLSTDAGFYFLSLHFKRCSARKLHIIFSIKVFTGSFCVAYSCWNQTWSGDVCSWRRQWQKQEEMKVTPLLLFKAVRLHLGSKTKEAVTSLRENERKGTKSKWCGRPCLLGIVTAGSSALLVTFLLMQMEVQSMLPHGCFSGTALLVEFCSLLWVMMCADRPLLLELSFQPRCSL